MAWSKSVTTNHMLKEHNSTTSSISFFPRRFNNHPDSLHMGVRKNYFKIPQFVELAHSTNMKYLRVYIMVKSFPLFDKITNSKQPNFK